jgi:hypothetical protein
MRLDNPINVDELPVAQYDNAPVPEGEYKAVIKSAELQNTKAGNGQYIKVRFDITGDSHAGRVVFSNINIRNPNPKAEEIGRQTLGELARAIGLKTVTDTDQLIGGQCQIKVTIRQSEGYAPQNEIRRYKAIEGAALPKPVAQAATPSSAPWAKPAF